MDNKHFVNKLVSIMGYIILFIVLEIWLNGIVYSIAWILIIVGIVVWISKKRILKLIGKYEKIINPILNTVAAILIFLGMKNYLRLLVEQYVIIMFIIGLVLFTYHKQIIDYIYKN